MAEVHLPVAGNVNKKVLLYGGGAVILIIAVLYYRKQKANSAAAAAAVSQSTQTDPQTGYPMGSPEDQAALASLAASVGTGGAYGGSSGTATQPAPVPGTGLTTNAQWAQQAIDYLSNTIQLPATDVSAALGVYLSGQPLTQTQEEIVNQAIAVEGPPPVAAPDGYPPNMRPTVNTPAPVPTPTPTPNPEPEYSGEPGFMYHVGSSQLLASVQAGGHTYGVNPLTIDGTDVSLPQFQSQAVPVLNRAGYKFSPPTGDFSIVGGFTPAMAQQGAAWIASHSVTTSGTVVGPNPA